MERWNSVVLCGFALSLRVCPEPGYSEMVRTYSEAPAPRYRFTKYCCPFGVTFVV